MTYSEFLTKLNTSVHIKDYYSQLIVHTKDILQDIESRNQGLVARDLHITQSKLSNILPLLKELYYAQH